MIHHEIAQTVQQNCDIADARFAGEYTLCIYLLKMRELYRWEKKLRFGESLPNEDIGKWLSAREEVWNDLYESDYLDIRIDGEHFSPYDAVAINKALKPHGLVYSGGQGHHGRPHFFLAELQHHEVVDDYQIYVANRELARDLTAPPAMSLDKNIYIRRESLRRMLWERLEEWRWHRIEGAMSRALQYYDFDNDLDTALDQMADNESEVLLQHEIGEVLAGRELGEAWHDMLASLPRSAGEFMARAVRDHLADCTTTLPTLIRERRDASLHFYFGNFNTMRKELFPSLHQAYQAWAHRDDMQPLVTLIDKARQHWLDLALQILDIYRQYGEDCLPVIEQRIRENTL